MCIARDACNLYGRLVISYKDNIVRLYFYILTRRKIDSEVCVKSTGVLKRTRGVRAVDYLRCYGYISKEVSACSSNAAHMVYQVSHRSIIISRRAIEPVDEDTS